MSAGGTAIREVLLQFNAHRRGYNLAGRYAGNEPPLRSELFSVDQMRQHGRHLAASHELLAGSTPDCLLRRLTENEDVLIRTRGMAAAAGMKRRIAPAGEWLLDNFYLIEEQIRTAKWHLPHEYSRGLPRLARGPSAGLPRVYDIALEAISHSDGHIDPERLGSFLAAYQTVAALTLGELWAIPIMLRLALIENLRRADSRLAADKIDRNRADYWADRMIETAQREPRNLIVVIADMARSQPPLAGSFVAELARRLQGQSPALALPLTWIEQRLSESGLTIQQLVQMENQQQAIDQASISNSIGSLRFLSAMDWSEFVETMSVVEQTLRRDPAGIYGTMEFATRDGYRHVVETLATRSAATEGEVAAAAIRLAQHSAAAQDADARTAAAVERFRAEPYVVPADICSDTPHAGRGGWTWCTGSAGWLYRLIIESLIGLRREADTLRFAPCLPPHWWHVEVDYRYCDTVYRLVIGQAPADAAMMVTVDGAERPDGIVALVDDRREHQVEVRVPDKFQAGGSDRGEGNVASSSDRASA